jgi:hypothetical protein
MGEAHRYGYSFWRSEGSHVFIPESLCLPLVAITDICICLRRRFRIVAALGRDGQSLAYVDPVEE